MPVDGFLRWFGSGDGGDRREEVHHGAKLRAGGADGHFAGPAGDAGHALGAFAGAVTHALVGCVAALRWVAVHGTVVVGPDDEGVVVDVVGFEGAEDFASGPVEFFNGVAVEAVGGFAAELGAGIAFFAAAGSGFGEVEEEGLLAMRGDEFHGGLGEAFRERFGRDGGIDDGFVLHERQGWPVFLGEFVVDHVLAVGNAEEDVEAVASRQKVRLVAEVPFAEAGGGVAVLLQELGHRLLAGMDAACGDGLQNGRADGADVQANAAWVATGHQGRATRCADSAGRVEAGELAPLRRHAIEVWCAMLRLRIEARDVPVAEVVAEDDDDIRTRLRRE